MDPLSQGNSITNATNKRIIKSNNQQYSSQVPNIPYAFQGDFYSQQPSSFQDQSNQQNYFPEDIQNYQTNKITIPPLAQNRSMIEEVKSNLSQNQFGMGPRMCVEQNPSSLIPSKQKSKTERNIQVLEKTNNLQSLISEQDKKRQSNLIQPKQLLEKDRGMVFPEKQFQSITINQNLEKFNIYEKDNQNSASNDIFAQYMTNISNLTMDSEEQKQQGILQRLQNISIIQQETQQQERFKTDGNFENSETFSQQERVFAQLLLLGDEQDENKYCVDCGWNIIQNRQKNHTNKDNIVKSRQNHNPFDQIYVSVNHGTFHCQNCAQIHQTQYGLEISFMKPIVQKLNKRSMYSINKTQVEDEIIDQKTDSRSNWTYKLSKWTYSQLRVLIISGGNRAFREYMDQYDLMQETIQKRYNTVAAQYYRDYLRNDVINSGNISTDPEEPITSQLLKSKSTIPQAPIQKGRHQKMLIQQPEYDKGRERSNNGEIKITKQAISYSRLNHNIILQNLLQSPSKKDLLKGYRELIEEEERINKENVEHFLQLCLHESQLIAANGKHTQRNLQELNEYKQTVIKKIEPSISPFFTPKMTPNAEPDNQQDPLVRFGVKVQEPFSEMDDYLDRDDFSNLLSVFGQYAGKTGQGLLNLGESIISSFVFKIKSANNNVPVAGDDYVVPGQKSTQSISPASVPKNLQKILKDDDGKQIIVQQEHTDIKAIIKEQASAATNKIQTLMKSGIFTGWFGQSQQKTGSGVVADDEEHD